MKVSRIRYYSFVLVIKVAIGRTLYKMFGSSLATRTCPSMAQMTGRSDKVYRSALDALEGMLGRSVEEYVDDFRIVATALDVRKAMVLSKFPDLWEVERETAMLLYCLIRATRPRMIVETGVANGASSFVMLAALVANGSGRLVSTDISSESGGLVPKEFESFWSLRVLDAAEPEPGMRETFALAAPIDIYFHDADHRYLGQLFEYQSVWPHIADAGWFLSDDVDCSHAWMDFADAGGLHPDILMDGRKAIGLVRKRTQMPKS